MDVKRYEYQSDLVRTWVYQGRAEGRIEAGAQALLVLLTARSVVLSEDVRTRIRTSNDAGELMRWTWRAATATSIDEVFGSTAMDGSCGERPEPDPTGPR